MKYSELKTAFISHNRRWDIPTGYYVPQIFTSIVAVSLTHPVQAISFLWETLEALWNCINGAFNFYCSHHGVSFFSTVLVWNNDVVFYAYWILYLNFLNLLKQMFMPSSRKFVYFVNMLLVPENKLFNNVLKRRIYKLGCMVLEFLIFQYVLFSYTLSLKTLMYFGGGTVHVISFTFVYLFRYTQYYSARLGFFMYIFPFCDSYSLLRFWKIFLTVMKWLA